MTARNRTLYKVIAGVAGGGALLAATPLVASAVTSDDPPPTVAAKGATLVDTGSGESLMDKSADKALPMASTTKIMVASVVLDDKNVDLDQKVPVKQAYRDYVEDNHTSTADLQTGDKVSLHQLLYASLLPSGADAAYALADTLGDGSTSKDRVDSFVEKMNDKADELRLTRTTYTTFDGSSAEDTSTPSNLAKLAEHAMQNATFRKVVKTKKYETEAPAANGHTRYYTWTTTNKLLGEYDGVVGVKTGTTSKAGECLVFAADRGDKHLVGTVLNSKKRYEDAGKMLDYGFGADDAKDLDLDKSAKKERD